MKEFINDLTLREYEIFRKKVIDRCCITRTTFSNWKSGLPVANRFHSKLNEIAQEVKGVEIYKN